MNKSDEFLKIPCIRIWSNRLIFDGREFSGDIPDYVLGFINGAWFVFNEEHKNELN